MVFWGRDIRGLTGLCYWCMYREGSFAGLAQLPCPILGIYNLDQSLVYSLGADVGTYDPHKREILSRS